MSGRCRVFAWKDGGMSVELLVWRAAEHVTRDQARAVYLAVKKESPSAGQSPDFVQDLPGQITVVGEHVLVAMDLDTMDEMSGKVFEAATAHDLVCYDPQRDLVHNTAPLGIYPGMQLHTGDGMIVTDPDLGLVRDTLATLSPQNPFAALVNFGLHFIQVSPAEEGYELEYKDGVMTATIEPELAEVQRAFEEYATGERDFLTRLSWS